MDPQIEGKKASWQDTILEASREDEENMSSLSSKKIKTALSRHKDKASNSAKKRKLGTQ